MDANQIQEAVEVGAWIGRKEAFSGMAGRCSAADARCLLDMKDGSKHKALGLSWDEFCKRHLGISRALADKKIRLLEEFGEEYFYLNSLIATTPEQYRLIAAAVTADGLQFGTERIPFTPQNTARLAQAIEDLSLLALPEPTQHKPIQDPVWRATKQLQCAIEELEELLADGPGQRDRGTLLLVLGSTSQRLGRLDRNLRG
jgi:hypothetical protein